MSAFEPQLPAEPKVDMPDFMVVLRGFDRRQVEMWAAEVANQIEQERLRADEAEKKLYRMQIENKGAPSFSHLGSHVASILEEAGRSSENMLADAAERAQETVDAAEEEAAEIIKAAEHRAAEIEQEARRTLEEAQAEGARVEEEALGAAEEMRAQAEQDARTVLEEARDATDMIWQEAERERVSVEAETIRLETLRHRSLEQLGRVYGHLESVLDEVRAGIGRVEEEEEDLEEATAAAAARLGVEPPASPLEPTPQFPTSRDEDAQPADATSPTDAQPAEATSQDETTEPVQAQSGPQAAASGSAATRPGSGPAEGEGGGVLAPTRPEEQDGSAEASGSSGPGQPQQPALSDAEPTPSATGATQPVPAGATEATQPVPAHSGSTEATAQTSNGEGRTDDQDATERLEPVGGKPARPPKPASKDAGA